MRYNAPVVADTLVPLKYGTLLNVHLVAAGSPYPNAPEALPVLLGSMAGLQ